MPSCVLRAQNRNKDCALGLVMFRLEMQPGSVLPAHSHEGVAEVLEVVERDFVNEGKQYRPGTSLQVKTGKLHGAHGTEKGCKDSCVAGQFAQSGYSKRAG